MRTESLIAPLEEVPAVVTLRPGYVHLAQEPTVVTTVLGSHVSATMHCGRFGAGAICHALFPGRVPVEVDEPFRCADRSVEAIVRKLHFVSHTGAVCLKRLVNGPGSAEAAPGRVFERVEGP